MFPRLRGAAAQPRQPALRRRAADAGDRPRAGAQPEAAAARRAARRAWRRSSSTNCWPRLRRIVREEGLSAIIVEQNARKILALTDEAVILDRGTSRAWRRRAPTLAARTSDALETHLGVAERAAATPDIQDRSHRRRDHDANTPPFRADMVGSLLRTAAAEGGARQKRRAGEIDAAGLKAVEDAEIRAIIRQAGGDRAARPSPTASSAAPAGTSISSSSSTA